MPEYENSFSDKVLDSVLIDNKSVAIVIGAYQGATVRYLYDRYKCTIHAFEPQPWAIEAAIKSIVTDRTYWYNYALGLTNGDHPVHGFGNDSCSFTPYLYSDCKLPMRKVDEVFDELGLTDVDLIHMNCEGYEYVLVPYLLTCGYMPTYFIIQWHPNTPYGDDRYERIAEHLRLFYDKLPVYEDSWEVWKRA